ncbi:hypothetical protein SERLADRAFT_459257 [Serpula lacrymans var. lacrymans S7.9]|uniref:Uncharacterized protein n=1 Tax=Serpula lacrymans var. lacrymans (strain S7.9) TaxID=578457 RepID=F8NLR8_SERL9|nr:uncharacterized protein SERLADRAFT_459257 [Serpula lacrymans var. lacrymans S7.9]EGO28620.1 hypothetical protein SERLADRAFT_459257 [Serpula lacrymans var. lacrymans S7.9]
MHPSEMYRLPALYPASRPAATSSLVPVPVSRYRLLTRRAQGLLCSLQHSYGAEYDGGGSDERVLPGSVLAVDVCDRELDAEAG